MVQCRDNILVLRRYTGGGTVIVDHNSVFTSWIMNVSTFVRSDTLWSYLIKPVCLQLVIGCKHVPVSARDHGVVGNHVQTRVRRLPGPCLGGQGTTPRFWRKIVPWLRYSPPPPSQFILREHDYVIGDKKIAGNAQTITKDRWVHHTSFLWDYDNHNMSYLSIPKKRPEYRANRDHNDFLRRLKPILVGDVAHFRQQLLRKTQEHYDVEVIDKEDDIEAFRHAVVAEKPDALQIRTKIETF